MILLDAMMQLYRANYKLSDLQTRKGQPTGMEFGFLKSLEAKRAEIFALEAESGGTGADLTKLEEEGMGPSIQLGEVFIQKRRKWPELRR